MSMTGKGLKLPSSWRRSWGWQHGPAEQGSGEREAHGRRGRAEPDLQRVPPEPAPGGVLRRKARRADSQALRG